jgi:hypothetical protein
MDEWQEFALKAINDRRGWLKPLAFDAAESESCSKHANYLIRIGKLEHAAQETLKGWNENIAHAFHTEGVRRASPREVNDIIRSLVEGMASSKNSFNNLKNAKERVGIGFSALDKRIVMVTRFK